MTDVHAATPTEDEKAQIVRLLSEARCPFGPRFFLTQLAAFVRESCPAPGELPRVDLWIDGEPHTICHVVTIAPRWIALAVWHGRGETARMSTEIVPYELIARVTIGAVSRAHAIGFAQLAPPAVVDDARTSPEETLDRLARPDLPLAPAGGSQATLPLDEHATSVHRIGECGELGGIAAPELRPSRDEQAADRQTPDHLMGR